MTYDDIYKLHLQLLNIYEKNQKCPVPHQKEVNYFKNQLFMYAEDIVQRIFVLNQLLKIYEKNREFQIKWCSDEYFSKVSSCEE